MSDYSDDDFGGENDFSGEDDDELNIDDDITETEYVTAYTEGGPQSSYQVALQSLMPSQEIEGIGGRVFLTPEQKVASEINKFVSGITGDPEQTDRVYGPMMESLATAFQRDENGLKLGAKNPWALVLGYLTYDKGDVTVRKFKEIIAGPVFADVPAEAGVQPPDVLRYAFFWKGFRKRFGQ